nr:DDE-type integrase/transposase/recombinase [Xanthomonas nasturtii]
MDLLSAHALPSSWHDFSRRASDACVLPNGCCLRCCCQPARYRRRPDRDEEVIALLSALAERFPERGVGKLFQIICRRGHVWNHKRVWRVYCMMKLNQRCRSRHRAPTRHPQPLACGDRPNAGWSIDFMSNVLWDGRRFRTFNVIDDFSREALAIEVHLNLPAARVIGTLERIAAWRGYPGKERGSRTDRTLAGRLQPPDTPRQSGRANARRVP